MRLPRSSDRYESMGDTFVQLFSLRPTGLIAQVASTTENQVRIQMSDKQTTVLTTAQRGFRAGHVGAHLEAGENTNERRLVALAKSGSSSAFGQLYERHRLRVYNTTYRVLRQRQEGEDAAQRFF